MPMARAIEFSENGKLGPMSTTYAGIGSCPATCPMLKNRACYGMQGPVSYQWKRLEESKDKLAIAKAEADQIDALSGALDLRLHTLGDCATDAAARTVSAAAERFMKRSRKGSKVFTFTHAWRKVQRSSWGAVSVLASCEKPADVAVARERGYATALVLPFFLRETAYEVDGVKVVPCPEQTGRAKSCYECRMCLNADKLRETGVTIGFKVHGPTIKAKAMLEKLGCS